MDKARGKRPLEEDVEVLMSINFDESDAEDDELTSVIRRSREEFDFLQKRKGIESSNEASEKRRPATVSEFGVLSIPPHRFIEQAPMTNKHGIISTNDTVLEWWICLYMIYFECGLRLPIHPLIIQMIADEVGVELSVDEFIALYYLQENSKDHGRYLIYLRRKQQVVGEIRNANRYWQDCSNNCSATPIESGMKLTSPTGALRRLFGTPLFIKPFSDEEALIAELALSTMKINFPSPKEIIASKWAEKEATKAAAATKAAEAAQVLTPTSFPLSDSSPELSNVLE
ncbi:hypothetical protein TIFTF001_015403 [Ficus carica]|uniref:Uncharacterized protein n=1 Tax=Ficus carica TaxID=3494 RepID=A0AA88ALH8_FICCA|nr:hypothetical protein TIFTF001_015403 [Ficus carica]